MNLIDFIKEYLGLLGISIFFNVIGSGSINQILFVAILELPLVFIVQVGKTKYQKYKIKNTKSKIQINKPISQCHRDVGLFICIFIEMLGIDILNRF